MANDKIHAIGDKVSVSGTITGVDENAGRTEYRVAVEDSDVDYDRPLNIPPAVDIALAASNGYAEYQKELLSRDNTRADDENPALSDEADKVREEKDLPDPRTKAAGNASVDVKPAAKTAAK